MYLVLDLFEPRAPALFPLSTHRFVSSTRTDQTRNAMKLFQSILATGLLSCLFVSARGESSSNNGNVSSHTRAYRMSPCGTNGGLELMSVPASLPPFCSFLLLCSISQLLDEVTVVSRTHAATMSMAYVQTPPMLHRLALSTTLTASTLIGLLLKLLLALRMLKHMASPMEPNRIRGTAMD